MDRRDFLETSGAALGTFALGGSARAQEQTRKPDVLFIAIEDVGPHRFGCYEEQMRHAC